MKPTDKRKKKESTISESLLVHLENRKERKMEKEDAIDYK